MPEGCSIRYKADQAPTGTEGLGNPKDDRPTITVDIGPASPQETRWWSAILAPGRGWEAALSVGRETFWSPWSVRVQSGPRLVVPRTDDSTFFARATTNLTPSFAEAFGFLNNFCTRHNIGDQGDAALAAVLLLPTMGAARKGLHLPAVVITNQPSHFEPAGSTTHSHPPPRATQLDGSAPGSPNSSPFQEPNWFPYMRHHLDRLMTLSCYTKGVRPMLLSAFYNPNVGCNAVSSWIQATMTMIDALIVRGETLIVARMLMDRNPNVALLWIGATVLGLQNNILEEVRRGHIPTNHLSAEWSGKIQCFIQQPVQGPLVPGGHDGAVSLADQCRLLYLARAEDRWRDPRCPWSPFGVTPLEDTDVEVRLHAECAGHGLRYRGFMWNCLNGRVSGGGGSCPDWNSSNQPSGLLSSVIEVCREQSVDYKGLCFEDAFVSAKATRRIFGWLRGKTGYAQGERAIWQHEWIRTPEFAAEWHVASETSESVETERGKGEREVVWESEGGEEATDSGTGDGNQRAINWHRTGTERRPRE